jgi:hypothetical protein
VEVPVDDVIGVVAVSDRSVSAVLAVLVSLVVAPAGMRGRAVGRVRAADGEAVAVDVVAVHVMHVPVVEIILVTIVLDRFVAALGAVLVIVLVVGLVVVAHGVLLVSVLAAREIQSSVSASAS